MLSIQLDLFGESAPSPSSGKTSPASSTLQTMPSDAFWELWQERRTRFSPEIVRVMENHPAFGDGTGKLGSTFRSGQCVVSYPDQPEPWPGESSTLSGLEWPNDAAVCSLWQVLERSVPSRFFLSSTVCAGILRRAEKRGKELPPMLAVALESVAIGAEARTQA